MIFSRFLDTNGDGTGTKNAVGNYSSTATPFYIQPAANQTFYLARMLITVRDSGAFDAEEYGNGIALTNGITVTIHHDEHGELYDLTDGEPIKSNTDWGTRCYDVDVKTWGTGDEVLLGRWTFEKAGEPLVLNAPRSLRVNLNDNLSGLVGHYFVVQGTYSREAES